MRRYYQILGVSPDATSDEIKEAWLFSTKAFHPDKFSGSSKKQQDVAHERTKAINEAYSVLSNPINRANYDREFAGQAAKPNPPPPPRPSQPPPPPRQSAAPRPTTQNPASTGIKFSWFWGSSGPPKYVRLYLISFGI